MLISSIIARCVVNGVHQIWLESGFKQRSQIGEGETLSKACEDAIQELETILVQIRRLYHDIPVDQR